ncbi:hypothetical protein [Hymenobacter sp.]|uniref:hypothetical protein n=1 Tax=Hymenobacter sp. TaxID=1898978 RepID=UPI00286B11F9|nr:hypothetical protein [Hymenobacter sp.]
MTRISRHLFVALALASGLSACGSKDKAAEQTAETSAATTAPVAPAPTETAPAASSPAAPTAPAEPTATFDMSTVPESTADLGPFPYLASLPNYEVNTSNSSSFDFERSYIYDGKNIIAVEGKVSRRLFQPKDRDKKSSALMVQRNYEELFKQIGAVKVSDTQVPREAVEKIGSDNYYKYNGGISGGNEPAYTYVLRQKGKEIWLQLEVSTDQYRLNVTERAAMAQQATLLKADELKKTRR